MADVFGNVTQLATTDEAVLYTCPLVSAAIDVNTAEDIIPQAQQAVTQTQICGITLASWSTGTNAFLYLTQVNTAPTTLGTATDYQLYGPMAASANTTTVFNPGLVLAPGNTIWVKAGAADKLTVTLSYIEIS